MHPDWLRIRHEEGVEDEEEEEGGRKKGRRVRHLANIKKKRKGGRKKQEMPAVVEKHLRQQSRRAPSPGVIQSKMTGEDFPGQQHEKWVLPWHCFPTHCVYRRAASSG